MSDVGNFFLSIECATNVPDFDAQNANISLHSLNHRGINVKNIDKLDY